MKKILTIVLMIAILATCALTGCSGEKLIGFDTELTEAVAEELGIKVEFKDINWDVKETLVEEGTINVIWNGFTYTTERDNGYTNEEGTQIGGLAFSKFYMENRQVAVVKKSEAANYTSVASFEGKAGCAEASSAGAKAITDLLGGVPAELEKQLDVFTAVTSGNKDYGVIDATMASVYVQAENGAYKNDLAVIEIGSENEYYAVGFKEGSNLADVFNYALAKVFASGKAEEIARKYGLQDVLYNGFADVDIENYTLPTDGQWKEIKEKGSVIVGYTIFAPMNYYEAK